jgi:hypothetical protein
MTTEEDGNGGIGGGFGKVAEPRIGDGIEHEEIGGETISGRKLATLMGHEDAGVDDGGVYDGREGVKKLAWALKSKKFA